MRKLRAVDLTNPLKYAPPWTRRIASSPQWMKAFEQHSAMQYITCSSFETPQQLYTKDSYDLICLALGASAPAKIKDFIFAV